MELKFNSVLEAENTAKEVIEATALMSYKRGYDDCRKTHEDDYDDGVRRGIQHVKNAVEWFHDTYGTTYILIDASSIDHLLNLFEEATCVE